MVHSSLDQPAGFERIRLSVSSRLKRGLLAASLLALGASLSWAQKLPHQAHQILCALHRWFWYRYRGQNRRRRHEQEHGATHLD